MITKHILTTILLCTLLQQYCFAQADKMETDRPDQTESPFTVPKKWMQMEMGFVQETDRYDKNSSKDYFFHHPTLLAKYGLAKRFELRAITEWSTEKYKLNSGWHSNTGISGIQLGGKLNFFDQKGWRPKTSLIAHYDFAGLRTLYKDTIDGANFRFTMQHTLSPVVSLGYNLGMRWDYFRYPPAFVYTFAPGFNISEKWYAYIEVFGSIWKNQKPENSIDGGIAYYINNNFKIDASAGFGISKEAPDNYISVGASYRFRTTRNNNY